MAAIIKADAQVLTATIARWNALCDAGEDSDFGRPRGTMVRLAPPYIVAQVIGAIIASAVLSAIASGTVAARTIEKRLARERATAS